MVITRKTKIIIVSIAVVTSFAVGRYSTPVKVKTETKTVEVEKKTDDKKVDKTENKRVKTTVTETIKPDGTKTITKVIEDNSVDKTKSDDKSTDSTKLDKDITKEVTKSSSPVTISALAGIDFSSGHYVFGASVSKPILGPITLGVFGLTNATGGISLGLQF